MATIVLGDNPGPAFSACRTGPAEVDVTLKDGEGATVIASYTDLDTLTETVRLFTEARTALVAAIIETCGVDRKVLELVKGDQIVVKNRDHRQIDDTIVTVHGIIVGGEGHHDLIRVVWHYDDGGHDYNFYDRDSTVVQIRKPLVLA